MRKVTHLDPQWFGLLSMGCKLLSVGDPLDIPVPKYDTDRDSIMCSVVTKFGDQGWILPPIQVKMDDALRKGSKNIMSDDSYRWFARYLLEGKVFKELKSLKGFLNDDPSIYHEEETVDQTTLSGNGISSGNDLIKYWVEKDSKFLFKNLKSWVKKENASEVKEMWIDMVKTDGRMERRE